MADRLRALRDGLETATTRAGGVLRRHAFWFALSTATLVVVVVAGVVGRTAMLRADSWTVRARELHATWEAAAVWRQELVGVSEAERTGWRASEVAVRDRAIDPGDRLALLQQVAQRAEDLGIADVSVAFESADTLGTTAIREVGEAVYEVAPWALAVRFVADYGTVAAFVGSLPPQVDVHRLSLGQTDAGVRARVVLLVFAAGQA